MAECPTRLFFDYLTLTSVVMALAREGDYEMMPVRACVS